MTVHAVATQQVDVGSSSLRVVADVITLCGGLSRTTALASPHQSPSAVCSVVIRGLQLLYSMANDRSRRRVFPASSSIALEKLWQSQRYEQHRNKVLL